MGNTGFKEVRRFGMWKLECGLRPVGAIGAYAPEGMRKDREMEVGMRRGWNVEVGKRRQMLGERFHVPGFRCQDSTPGGPRPDTLY